MSRTSLTHHKPNARQQKGLEHFFAGQNRIADLEFRLDTGMILPCLTPSV